MNGYLWENNSYCVVAVTLLLILSTDAKLFLQYFQVVLLSWSTIISQFQRGQENY